jgi:hypothetical protein
MPRRQSRKTAQNEPAVEKRRDNFMTVGCKNARTPFLV